MEKLCLITCVVQKGYADAVIDAALRAGAAAATTCDAKGTGLRQRLGELGEYIHEEKEIIKFVVGKKIKKDVFNAVAKAANLDQPGRGIVFISQVEEVYGI